MKKVIFLFIIFLFPFLVAAQNDYKVTDFYISSEVEIAGAIKVKELIVLDKPVDEITRKIDYKNFSKEEWQAKHINFENSSIYNANSLDSVKVGCIDEAKIDFDTMGKVNDFLKLSDDKTPSNDSYTIKESKNGSDVNIKFKNKQKVIYLEYIITNAVVIHEDVAELYYPYVSKSFDKNIDNLNIRVFIPQYDDSDNFQVWLHGLAKGKVQKYTTKTNEAYGILAELKNVKAKSGVDVRMTFDKSEIMIDEFLDHSKQKALSQIKKVEEKRTNKTHKSKIIKNVFLIAIGVYIIGMVVIIIILKKKKMREMN